MSPIYPAEMSITKGLIDMLFQPNRPCNDRAGLPPSEDVETKAVLKACIAAGAVRAELRVWGRLFRTTQF